MRYWDGSRWALHVMDSGIPRIDELAQGPSTAASAPMSPRSSEVGGNDLRGGVQTVEDEPVLVRIGDLSVSEHWVRTPNGDAPVSGAQWIWRDSTRQVKSD